MKSLADFGTLQLTPGSSEMLIGLIKLLPSEKKRVWRWFCGGLSLSGLSSPAGLSAVRWSQEH